MLKLILLFNTIDFIEHKSQLSGRENHLTFTHSPPCCSPFMQEGHMIQSLTPVPWGIPARLAQTLPKLEGLGTYFISKEDKFSLFAHQEERKNMQV